MPGRPPVERPHRRGLGRRRVVPLAERRRAVAVVAKHLGDGRGVLGDHPGIAVPVHRALGDRAGVRHGDGFARSAAPPWSESRSRWCERCCSRCRFRPLAETPGFAPRRRPRRTGRTPRRRAERRGCSAHPPADAGARHGVDGSIRPACRRRCWPTKPGGRAVSLRQRAPCPPLFTSFRRGVAAVLKREAGSGPPSRRSGSVYKLARSSGTSTACSCSVSRGTISSVRS